MKEVFFNDENIQDFEIDEKVTRVKALMINDEREILLSCCEDIYQFPGGHLERGETLEDALRREIKEELGIELKNLKSPFLHISNRKRNYRNSGKNRHNDIYYYLIKTNENCHLNKTNYDEYELKGNYKARRVPLNDFSNILSENELNKNDCLGLTKEMLSAYDELLKLI